MSDHPSHAQQKSADRRPRRPLFRSKLFALAIIVTLFGAGSWAYSASTRKGYAQKEVERQSLTQTGSEFVKGLADAAQGKEVTTVKPRLVDESAPATFRFGASFIAGFLIGFAAKKFLKLTLLIAAVLGAGIFFLKKSGVITLDWNSVEHQVDEGVEWAKSSTGGIKNFLTGYIPSSAAGLVGLFWGARKG